MIGLFRTHKDHTFPATVLGLDSERLGVSLPPNLFLSCIARCKGAKREGYNMQSRLQGIRVYLRGRRHGLVCGHLLQFLRYGHKITSSSAGPSMQREWDLLVAALHTV